jgi:hypothetical protein
MALTDKDCSHINALCCEIKIKPENIMMTVKRITDGGILFKKFSPRGDNCPGAIVSFSLK